MVNTTFKIVTTSEEPFECEDCGTCYPEGLYIAYNDEVIWESYSDGHMSGHETEETILECILSKMYENTLLQHEEEKSEKARLKWNKDNPGNAIGVSQQSWKEFQENCFYHNKESIEEVKINSAHLPYDKELQVKMIALWIEYSTGEKIQVITLEE